MQVTYVDEQLRKCIQKKVVTGHDLEAHVQPASIDIPVGKQAYLVKHTFLPFRQDVQSLVDELCIQTVDLTKEVVLLKGHTYLFKCLKIDLPEGVSGRISPKSSIGRVDLLVRAVTDNSGLYDTISAGTTGEVWLTVTPQSFNVRIQPQTPLAQLRLFTQEPGTVTLPDPKDVLLETYNPESNFVLDDNKISLSLGGHRAEIVGYEARDTSEVLDLSKRDHDPNVFFREIRAAPRGDITLEKGHFYILATRELIRVPKEYSVEMEASTPSVGELRVHYAGFFDPGFGEPSGASGVLEIRPHETLTVYEGQPICMLEFFKNSQVPASLYGEAGNNYQGQRGPRLAKFFK